MKQNHHWVLHSVSYRAFFKLKSGIQVQWDSSEDQVPALAMEGLGFNQSPVRHVLPALPLGCTELKTESGCGGTSLLSLHWRGWKQEDDYESSLPNETLYQINRWKKKVIQMTD